MKINQKMKQRGSDMKRISVSLFFVLSVCLTVATVFAQNEKGDVMKSETAVLETTQGTIEFKLFCDVAPKTCDNFTGLIKKGYYDGVIFHRIIKDFMIQGGDPTGTGRGGESLWGGKFEDEVSPSVKFDRPGLLAMANAGPGTNGSQFFITTIATGWLNMKHTIFGEVSSGMDVVKKLENVQTGYGDKPIQEQKIIKAYLK